MYYPEDVVQQVVQANDIVEVVGQYVSLKRSGANYFGLCPFHREKSPSFSVSPSKQMFYCFGCGEGGNVIGFLMKYENYSFQEALKVLADRAGIKLPEENYSEEAKAAAKQKEELFAINKAAATYYFHLLRSPRGEKGMEYLKGRQLSADTMNRFGLGYADGARSDMVAYLRRKGFSDENILLSGIAAFDEKQGLHDKFWNRVIFPIMDVTNRVIGFGGRVMGDGKPKYLNSPETPIFDKGRNLYGLNIAKKNRSGYMILCEGYMDTISMHQAGFDMAVASLGTSFTGGQAQVLKRYTKRVLLDYDSDDAGVRAALRNMEILRQAGLPCRVVNMNPAKDADEFMKTLGKEEFQKRLDNAEDAFFYQIRQVQSAYRMDDPAQKTQFQHEIARRLCQFDDEMERENYTAAMAEKYFIPVDVLRREVASYEKAGAGEQGSALSSGSPRMRPRNIQGEQKKTQEDAARERNESLLLTWLSDDPGLYPQIREYISPSDFDEGIFREAAENYLGKLQKHFGDDLAMESITQGGKSAGDSSDISPGSVIALFEDEEEQKKAAGMFETRIPGLESDQQKEKAIKDVLVFLKRRSLSELSKSNDPQALKQIVEINRQLPKIQQLHLVLKEA